MDYNRAAKCDNLQGGSSKVYVFPYVEYLDSQISVVNNVLTAFPFSTIYNMNANNINYNVEGKNEKDIEYSERISFQLNELSEADIDFKEFLAQDYRVIIKDNNGRYRLFGLINGLNCDYKEDQGTNRSEFNGYSFSFEGKEFDSAPYIDNLDAFFEGPNLNPFESFKIQVLTTAPDENFTIPTESGFVYGYSYVTSDGQAAFDNIGDATITFPIAGSYEIDIRGNFPKIFFNNSGDKDKITAVNQWGAYGVGELNQTFAFFGCSNLVSIADDCANINLTINGRDMFSGCNLNTLPSTLSFDALLLGDGMFEDNALTSLPEIMTLPNLNDGSGMFKNNALTSLQDGMLLNNLVNSVDMFANNLLTSLPSLMTLGNLRTGQTMFDSNPITALPSGMFLDKLINGSGMFSDCDLAGLPSGMTLGNLLAADGMFRLNPLVSLPSTLTLANLISGAEMFTNTLLASLPETMTLPMLSNGIRMFQLIPLTDLPIGMTLPRLTNGFNMFVGVTINTTRYSQLLVDFENLNPNNEVAFHGGNSKYNATGETARNILIASPRLWTITDGGLEI